MVPFAPPGNFKNFFFIFPPHLYECNDGLQYLARVTLKSVWSDDVFVAHCSDGESHGACTCYSVPQSWLLLSLSCV